MVSSNEAGFNLREIVPLPGEPRFCIAGLRTGRYPAANGLRGMLTSKGSPRPVMDHYWPKGWSRLPDLLGPVRDSAERGLGCMDNRHLNDLAESTFMNRRDPHAEISSRSMNRVGVGAAIVVGGRESRPHGEGPQSVGSSKQTNRMITGRNCSHECR